MKKHLQYFFSLVVAVFLNMNTYAQDIPDTLSTSYGYGADSFISNDDKGASDATYNGVTFQGDYYLVVRNHEVRKRITYLRYDIIDNPRFDGANQAYIGIYVNFSDKMAGDSVEIAVYGMTDDESDTWEADLLSYDNAPGMLPADLNSYELDNLIVDSLTTITVWLNDTGWIYSEPSVEMDDFINADNNGLLTFILLVRETNTGDELRFFAGEDIYRAPILHGEDPISNIENRTLSGIKLQQNYPNPFNGKTTITYNINQPEHVELTMYNILGTKVATLVDKFQQTGEYRIDVDMDKLQLSPGIYYTTINVDSNKQTIKMISYK